MQSEYQKIEENYFEPFNDFVFISKPLISNDRNIMIIYEFFYDNHFCSTGKQRTYMFKKINNKWNLIYLYYH